MTKIRTRFAPSPTGRMHVGNLRTALYAYLITKHEGGDFILRIEDTDQERYVEGAVDIIYRTLAKTGLLHDEGPDKDKGFGPYVQSERQAQGIYLKYAQQLVEQGDAYYCFCKKEELEGMKRVVAGKEISIYDKRCLKLSKEEVQRRLDAGEPHVIRFNMPTEGTTTFHDVIYGDITVNNEELEDLILIKSDGYPTYNFANVIDDHLMEITHVVRGNEYLSSAPKYNRIYEAFGWDIPVYVHCPLITDETHQKLSKRCGHSSYEDLLDQGFVSEAIINYVALLGWSPSDNREIFTLDELVQVFDYHHINKSPAVFDIAKLRWMNGEYIKKMDADEFYERALPYMKEVLKKDYNFKKIAGMVQTRIETFPDIPALIDFFEEVPEYDSAMYCHKKMKTNEETSLAVLKEVLSQCPVHAISLGENVDVKQSVQKKLDKLQALANGLVVKRDDVAFPESYCVVTNFPYIGSSRYEYRSSSSAESAGLSAFTSRAYSQIDSKILDCITSYRVNIIKPYYSTDERSAYTIFNKKIADILTAITNLIGKDKFSSDFCKVDVYPDRDTVWKMLENGEIVGENFISIVKREFEYSASYYRTYIDYDDTEVTEYGRGMFGRDREVTKYSYNAQDAVNELRSDLQNAISWAKSDITDAAFDYVRGLVISYNRNLKACLDKKIQEIKKIQ